MNDKEIVGQPINRVDGILKVTGAANYATDYPVKNVAHAILFKSTIGAGSISSIDSKDAEKSPGVLKVITHENALKLNGKGGLRGGALLQDNLVKFYGQHIGMVVAETFEQARYAAKLIRVEYNTDKVIADTNLLETDGVTPKDNPDVVHGDAAAAYLLADHHIDAVYSTPIEHHHPMEPHATIAVWEGEQVTLYNASQVINGAQTSAAKTLGIPPEKVRIVSPFIGGGFGSKGAQWANLVLCAVAAKMVNRPVKLALTRQQMFNSVGLRQKNHQHIKLSTDATGKLTSLSHETFTHAAIDSEYVEGCGDGSKVQYDVANIDIRYKVTPMHIILPTYTRGPGKSTGSFALESAIDELAYQLKIDPVEFRIKNEPAKDPMSGKPWSSRAVVQCLQEGAKAFGWNKRHLEPQQHSEGDYWIGYGVGCGSYPARQRDSSASIELTRKGSEVKAVVAIAASDLGTGTNTILAQTAADGLGIAVSNVIVKLGDSDLPPAAGSVGSVGAASFANAVNDACMQMTQELQAKTNKQFVTKPTAAQLMIAEAIPNYRVRVDAKAPSNAGDYSSHSFNANFAEVWVNKFTGMVRVKRFVAVTGAGKILNQKTSRSQILGGVVWGIGMALTEESLIDKRWGNFITRSFADYHVPSNLDVGEIETIFIDEKDTIVNKMGVKGIGEVGIVGVAAAIANAVFNATGKRVRELPITPDKLL